MPKLATIEKSSNQGLKNKQNHIELIALYNRLDNQQKTEFNQRLAQIIKQPVLPQQVEDYLVSLTTDNYDRILIYTKLLLFS